MPEAVEEQISKIYESEVRGTPYQTSADNLNTWIYNYRTRQQSVNWTTWMVGPHYMQGHLTTLIHSILPWVILKLFDRTLTRDRGSEKDKVGSSSSRTFKLNPEVTAGLHTSFSEFFYDRFGNDMISVDIKSHRVDCGFVDEETQIQYIYQLKILSGHVRSFQCAQGGMEMEAAGYRTCRRLRVAYMSSYGSSLNECKDAMHLLKVAFDGILSICFFVYVYWNVAAHSFYYSTSATSFARYLTPRY